MAQHPSGARQHLAPPEAGTKGLSVDGWNAMRGRVIALFWLHHCFVRVVVLLMIALLWLH